MLCLKHLKTIIVVKIPECFRTSSGLSQKPKRFFCTKRAEKPQDNRISLTLCEQRGLSKVTRSSPCHTQRHAWRGHLKPQLWGDNTCVSSHGHSQHLVGGKGGLSGPGEATYVKFFTLGDDFCVGNDGRRLTSEELVGWKRANEANVKLGVKAATAILALSTGLSSKASLSTSRRNWQKRNQSFPPPNPTEMAPGMSAPKHLPPVSYT